MLKPKQLIIGLVGGKGSGKGTFAKIFEQLATPKYSTIRIRFSDILFETLNNWSLPTTRSNLQNLAIIMEKQFGDGTLAKATRVRINKLSQDIIILDGIRRWSEANFIRSFSNNIIIYISAGIKIRYRNLKTKSDKADEEGLSFAKFMKEEKNKSEQLIPKIGASSDFKINNNGTLEGYRSQVKEFYKQYPFPKL